MNKNMQGLPLILLSIGLIFGLGAGHRLIREYFTSSDSGKQINGQMEMKIGEFVLPDREGRNWQLSEFKGLPFVIHFWATWCIPCREELPLLLAFAARPANLGMKFILVSLDRSWEAAERYLPKELPENLVSLLDSESRVSSSWGLSQFPHTLLFNQHLEGVWQWEGPQNWESAEFSKTLSGKWAKLLDPPDYQE